jgi:hypothetical protein
MLLARAQNNTVWIAIKLSVCSIFPPFYILCHLIWVVFVSFVQLYSIVFGEASCTQFICEMLHLYPLVKLFNLLIKKFTSSGLFDVTAAKESLKMIWHAI